MPFPLKGDRVSQANYGPGTVTQIDVHHTVIDFDAHGTRRFVTNRVLERTSDPGPSASERGAAEARRKRDERKRRRGRASRPELTGVAVRASCSPNAS